MRIILIKEKFYLKREPGDGKEALDFLKDVLGVTGAAHGIDDHEEPLAQLLRPRPKSQMNGQTRKEWSPRLVSLSNEFLVSLFG